MCQGDLHGRPFVLGEHEVCFYTGQRGFKISGIRRSERNSFVCLWMVERQRICMQGGTRNDFCFRRTIENVTQQWMT